MTALQVRRKRVRQPTETPRGLVSYTDWKRRSVKYGLGTGHVVLLVLLVVCGLGPILWLAKGAITPTQDTLIRPMSIFPHGVALSNLSDAWTTVDIGLYLWNTIVIALGSWICQIIVSTTGAYALSVLRPKWGRFVTAALLTTLFVPSVVLLVPLYIEIVHPPLIGGTYVNNYLAIWLPEAASAFNVVLMKRFFDNLPRELFEAARSTAAVGSACSYRSCCRCRSRYWASYQFSPCLPRGRTSSGHCSSSVTPTCSRYRSACRRSRAKRSWGCSWPRC